MPSSDRLTIEHAFEDLETRGILARADYQCCTGCSSYALRQEIDEYKGATPPIGGVCFHEQSTDGANEGGSLYLGYIATSDDLAEASRVPDLIVITLAEHGLKTIWDGDFNMKIQVLPPSGGRWNLDYDRHIDEDEDDDSDYRGREYRDEA